MREQWLVPLAEDMPVNEALELARTFSTEESVKFINGMLDAIRRKLEAAPDTPTTGNPPGNDVV